MVTLKAKEESGKWGRFGSGLYHGCFNAPKKKLHPLY
jgi:hypothetical protein